MSGDGAAFDWNRLISALPTLFCFLLFLNGISFSFRGLTFGPLLVEARSKSVRRSFPLSDLVALMVMMQLAAGGAIAFSRRPGFKLDTLQWNPPFDPVTTAAVIIVLVGVMLWWWWDSAWMLNAAEVQSGWRRFTFLVVWTPIGYASHWLIFLGGCGVLATLASGRTGFHRYGDTVRITSALYFAIGSFFMLSLGLIGAIAARWATDRLADAAFEARIAQFRGGDWARENRQDNAPAADEGEQDVDELEADEKDEEVDEVEAGEDEASEDDEGGEEDRDEARIDGA